MYLLLSFSIFQHSFSKSSFKLLVCNHANNSESQSFTTQNNFTPTKIFINELFAVDENEQKASIWISIQNWSFQHHILGEVRWHNKAQNLAKYKEVNQPWSEFWQMIESKFCQRIEDFKIKSAIWSKEKKIPWSSALIG